MIRTRTNAQTRRTLVAALLLLMAACSDSSPPGPTGDNVPRGARFSPTPVQIVTTPADGWFESACELDPELLRRVKKGYYPKRSPDVLFVPREPNFFGGFRATSHSGPWDYLQRVPLVFYGPGFIRSRGSIDIGREATVADLAPTFAELLGIDFPAARPGRSIEEVLIPEARRPGRPRLIVTVVWDGGGWNVLDTWPNAWPRLRDIMRKGTSVANAIAGSSPSVTPAVHATIGTGAFPEQHGVVAIIQRLQGKVVSAFAGRNPKILRTTSLADLYDPTTANDALIGMFAYKSWHLGMIGHGAFLEGGDKDLAVLVDLKERLVTNEAFYSLPEYLSGVAGLDDALRRVDLDDGKKDDTWMGHKILDQPRWRRDTPAWAIYQTRLIQSLLDREGFGTDRVPDLFYTNYKQIDEVGHNWNMLSPEMGEILRYTDAELGRLIGWLDSHVGKRRWVLALTADHGQGPDPKTFGAWPINMPALENDLGKRFGVQPNELISDSSAGGFSLDADFMRQEAITEEEVADFFVSYRLEENVQAGTEPPPEYRDRLREPIFAAAFPDDALQDVIACSRGRAAD